VGNAGSLTGATLASSSGQELTVKNAGKFSLGPAVPTGWVATLGGKSGLLDVLAGPGHAGPEHTIIGPPGLGGTYSIANGSIEQNIPHNPFLNQTATFLISGAGITANTTITSATFSFGTVAGIDVKGQPLPAGPSSVPAPSSLVLTVIGLGLVGTIGSFRRHRRA
jgi:hypothetical protein